MGASSVHGDHPPDPPRPAARGDDATAWREFDERYRELVLRACRAAGLQAADAEDVRQVVMLSLARAMPRFRYEPRIGRFRDYVGTTVRNAIRKHAARQVRGGEVLVSDVADLAEGGADDGEWREQWNEQWRLHHYRRAMAKVRASFRPRSLEIFDGLLEGRSGEELAAAFGTTPDAVYKIKQRVRDRLRELVAQQLAEEGDLDEVQVAKEIPRGDLPRHAKGAPVGDRSDEAPR